MDVSSKQNKVSQSDSQRVEPVIVLMINLRSNGAAIEYVEQINSNRLHRF